MYKVLGFYKFVPIDDVEKKIDQFRVWATELKLLGTVLVAREGINGSLAGTETALQHWRKRLSAIASFADMRFHLTDAGERRPFYRLKIKPRKEIIPLCSGRVCPGADQLKYLEWSDWNALLEDREALIIDVRNSFEYRVGHFRGAINSGLKNFSDFDRLLRANQTWRKSRIVGMYCTGGIRCEKSASLWRQLSDSEVYQLRGGVLHYLQTVPAERNAWEGECFVFDYRVSLDRNLQPGTYTLCYGCGEPLDPEQRTDTRFRFGVSCPYCFGKKSPAAIGAAQERVRQIELAKARGEAHLINFNPASERSSVS